LVSCGFTGEKVENLTTVDFEEGEIELYRWDIS
jgi:hypothetical protein